MGPPHVQFNTGVVIQVPSTMQMLPRENTPSQNPIPRRLGIGKQSLSLCLLIGHDMAHGRGKLCENTIAYAT